MTAQTLEQLLIARERQIWEALLHRDVTGFLSVVAEDALLASSNGTRLSGTAYTEFINTGMVSEYSIEDIVFKLLSNDSAVLNYKVDVSGTFPGGEDFSKKLFTSTVWAKRGETWLAVFSQDSPIL